MNLKNFVPFLLFINLLLTACIADRRTDDSTVVTTSKPIPTTQITTTPSHTPTNTAIPTIPPTITPTVIVLPTMTTRPTATSRPSETAASTITPSVTPTLEPLPPLTIRNPSIEQLQEYLLNIPAAYFNQAYGYPNPPEDEVKVLRFHGFTEIANIIYEDLNGDGFDDMIFHDDGVLAIWLWQNLAYGDPFLLLRVSDHYSSASRFNLEDWTNDGIPEVAWITHFGGRYGTGISGASWGYKVISCQQEMCKLVWWHGIASYEENTNDGGINLYRTHLVKSINDREEVILTYSESGFEFYPSDTMYGEPLVIYPSTVTTFAWTGAEFEEQSAETLSELQRINEDKSLEAVNSDGVEVEILAHSNYAADAGNDVCQLIVNGQSVGQAFGCKEIFTKVTWQDITNDGQPEIVITTLSGSNPKDEERNVLSEISCVHERFLAYQWKDGTAREIANVAGCLVQTDLYGVRLQDIDEDDQVEIVLASRLTSEPECSEDFPIHCWFELDPIDHVYKWDGATFVFWGELEQE